MPLLLVGGTYTVLLNVYPTYYSITFQFFDFFTKFQQIWNNTQKEILHMNNFYSLQVLLATICNNVPGTEHTWMAYWEQIWLTNHFTVVENRQMNTAKGWWKSLSNFLVLEMKIWGDLRLRVSLFEWRYKMDVSKLKARRTWNEIAVSCYDVGKLHTIAITSEQHKFFW